MEPMRLTASIEVLGLYLIAFGIRSLWQRMRTGKTGFAGVRKGARTPEKFSALLMVIVLTLGPIAPWTGSILFGWGQQLGSVVAGSGIALTLLAQLQMGLSWRIGVDPTEQTALVTSGVFALVRNPVFSAMLLTSIGIALMAPTAVSLALPPLLLLALEIQVRLVEEPYLMRTHGHSYAQWAARTGRFVPGLGRLTQDNG